MKHFTLLAILVPVLLACERREESASTTPATQAAQQQPASPPVASSEPAQAAPQAAPPQTSAAKPTTPDTGQTSGSGSSGDYTVAEGDTLSGIAQEHGVNRQDLAKWNNIKDPNRIYPGQTLTLTGPGS